MASRAEVALVALTLLFVACERADSGPAATADSSAVVFDSMDGAPTPGDSAPAPDAATPAASAGAEAAERALRVALGRLVRGAVPDSATWFSAQTADILRAVAVDANGHAVVDLVDLRPLIPNASSSASSGMLLAQLNATVFSVPGVASVEYRMAGSCALLGEWLQYGTCLRFDRPQAR